MTNNVPYHPQIISKRMEATQRYLPLPPQKRRSKHFEYNESEHWYTSKNLRKSSQNSSKIGPKSFQNRPLGPSGTPTWKMIDFWSILGSILDPKGTPKSIKNRSFFRPVFEWLFGTTFSCFWPPFWLPKRPQNETKKGPNTKSKNHRFCCYLLHLRHIEGSLKSSFLVLFWNPFLDTFSRPLFHRFWTLLGTLLGPFGHQKSTLKNTPKKDNKKDPKMNLS